MQAKDRILIALDVPSLRDADRLVTGLAMHVGGNKIGLELQSAAGGPQAVQFVHERRGRVFYDGKFNDISNTVAGAIRAVLERPVAMLNVHCLGGRRMLEKAVETVREMHERTGHRALLLGITILTSLDFEQAVEVGIVEQMPRILGMDYRDQWEREKMSGAVRKLALLAQHCGLDGIICSPQEVAIVREAVGPEVKIVVPGVRSAGADVQDQRRTGTPAQAILDGADYLVIGREATSAEDPVAVVKKIAADIDEALAA